MTIEQHLALRELLLGQVGEFHHGDCVGADAEAHDMAVALGLEPVIHPPESDSKRAWKGAKRILAPHPYLVRNRRIVDGTERLIAAPRDFAERLRSGTWSTIRYARNRGRKVVIIMPDGTVQ